MASWRIGGGGGLMPLFVCAWGGDCGNTGEDDSEFVMKDGSLGLSLRILKATNIPKLHSLTGAVKQPSTSVTVEVLIPAEGGKGQEKDKDKPKDRRISKARTDRIPEETTIEWNEVVGLGDASTWDLKTTKVRISIFVKASREHCIGTHDMKLGDLIKRPVAWVLMEDSDHNPILSNVDYPRMPCEVQVAIEADSMPQAWPHPLLDPPLPPKGFPSHVFMMTRGTRGDVQPFVALARGMAKQKGYLVTICTEEPFQEFVEKNASGVEPGRIQFRSCGGDTEAQVADPLSQWATNRKTEAMQMLILALSEANFFNTCSTFINQAKRLEMEGMPPKLLVSGLTVTAVAMLTSEVCQVPMISFNLQPAGIPSESKSWQPVQAIDSHSYQVIDKMEDELLCTHKVLRKVKTVAERNYFTRNNIASIRQEYGLPDVKTWDEMRRQNVPIVIPMKPGTFDKPPDWWSTVRLTDFIFLRNAPPGAGGSHTLGEPLDSFIAKAKEAGASLCLMTFSSMPVRRAAMLKCSVRMVKECNYNLRLIYVGKRQPDQPEAALVREAEGLTREGKFIDVERADFGVLFEHIDLFVVHGGLGTTVEALRKKKPMAVTGPLLMDQRFWGDVVNKKGVGPPACHIDDFPARCVDFVNTALDPSDPQRWRYNASKSSWGAESDDGVKRNVDEFVRLARNLKPIKTQ